MTVTQEPSGAAGASHREREHFFAAAKVIAGLTLLSRVGGMVRDMAIASLGADLRTGAFVLAWKVPNLFRRLFGEGALTAAFVPVFSETAEKDGFPQAGRLLANAMALLAVFLSALTAVMLAALLTWQAIWPGGWDRQLLVGLVSVMLPFMVTICLLALGSAALNCRGHFAYPAAAPIFLNVVIVAAAWFVAPAWRDSPNGKLYVIAASVTFGGLLQLVGVLWLLRRSGFSAPLRLRPVHGGIRPMLRLMGPMVLALGFPQIASLLEGIIIWALSQRPDSPTLSLLGWDIPRMLPASTQVHVYLAGQLYQFPMGVLAISLSVAVFPLLSRYAARNDMPSMRQSLNRAIRLSIMEALAAGTGLLVLAEPVTTLIYQRRKFEPADAAGVAMLLKIYLLGMCAFCTYQIFLKAFYALKQPMRPLKVTAAMAVLNVALVVALLSVSGVGAAAFAIATVATMSANVLVLAIMLRKRLGPLGGKGIFISAARSAAACAVMAAAVAVVRRWLTGAGSLAIVSAGVPVGAGVFFAAAWLLRAPELGELFGAFRNRKQLDEPMSDTPAK